MIENVIFEFNERKIIETILRITYAGFSFQIEYSPIQIKYFSFQINVVFK